MVSADGAVVNHDVPGPEGDRVPLFLLSVDKLYHADWEAKGNTFLTSKRFLSSPPDLPALLAAAFAGGASVMSTSAIVCVLESLFGLFGEFGGGSTGLDVR